MLIIKYIYLLFRTMESSFQAITVFILSSLMALTVLHHFMKARWERVWCALCAVPLLTFLVFYYHNRIIGMPELTLQRRTEAIKKFFGTPADNENFHACMISDGVGYLRITEESYKNDPPLDVIKDCLDGYSKELYAELDGKLNSLSGQGMKSHSFSISPCLVTWDTI